MSRATPWSIQSVHPDMQDAARDAALREGLSLRQWIVRAVEAHAADKGLDPDELDQDERDIAISERLAHAAFNEPARPFSLDPTSRGPSSTAAGHGVNKVDGMLKDLATRLRDNARNQTPKPLSPPTPWTQAPAQARQAQRSALQDALQEALRVAQREAAPAAPPPAPPRPAPQRPAPLPPREQSLAESAALRQQIDELARNVANLPRKMNQERDATADERALRKLSARTDEIRDLLSSVIARPTQTNRIERQLDLLGARIDELSACAPTMAECNELSRGLGEIRSLLGQGRNPDLLEALDRKIDQLSRKMEAMTGEPRDSHKFDDLARRIDNVHRRIEANITQAPRADTSAFERMIEELKRKLDQPAPKVEIPTLDFSSMESEIRRLSNKIDAAAARPENPALDGLRRDIASLSARVDALSATVQSSSTLSTQANSSSLEALRKEVQGLSSRIDRIASTAPEVSVLDGLQSQMEILVDRIEALPRRDPPGVHALEAQIVKLADKIDAIAGPSREETMLAQLQTEIARLSKRLDAAPEGSAAPALAMLEQVQQHLAQLPVQQRAGRTPGQGIDNSITDMVQQIQTLRDAAMDAVEASERQAQQEAAAQKPQEPGLNEALQRELTDLRAQQQNAEQRTTQVLNAVHETLNRLVSRLSDLEDDLSEVRPEALVAPPVQAQPKQTQETRREPQLETPAPAAAPRVEVRPEPVSAPAPAKEAIQPRQREPGPAAVLSNQASFIAAARRAAHAAGGETEPQPPKPTAMARIEGLIAEISARATEVRAEPVEIAPKSAERQAPAAKAPEARTFEASPPEGKTPAVDERNTDGTLSAIRRVLSARRRPMLIALAGLLAILGSLQALRMARNGETPVSLSATAAPPAPTAAAAPAPAAASAPTQAARSPQGEAPAPAPAPVVSIASPETLPAAGFTPPLAANGFDAPAPATTPPPPPPQAVSLAEAAANGQANAQYEMGVRLAEGRGVTQDNPAALQWLDKAAKQNLAPAQYRLAAMLERGLGAPKDLKRAQELYNKAATQGHVRAMHNMGVLSAEGVEGKPDYGSAASWFRKAADFGLRDSQYNLAILYARGMGVDKNLPVSFAWFNAAAAQGDTDSAQKRDEIAARLTPTQMAAAKAMIEAFSPRMPDPVANDVAQPAGGWDMMAVSSIAPKPAARAPAPAPKAKVTKLNQ